MLGKNQYGLILLSACSDNPDKVNEVQFGGEVMGLSQIHESEWFTIIM